MAVIINITHNAGGTLVANGYSGAIGADVSITTAAGLAMTANGLNVLVNDTDDDYGYIDIGAPDASHTVRSRFYFDPNSLASTALGTHTINRLSNSTHAIVGGIIVASNGGAYTVYARAYNDVPAAVDTSAYAITDNPHIIEWALTRAATNVSADGTLRLWVDGLLRETISTIDNYDRFPDVEWGYLGFLDQLATDSGTVFLDEWIVNNDGGLIGTLEPSTAALGALAYGAQFPTRGEYDIAWTTWDNGSAGAITVSGDPNWGKGELDIGEEMRGAVYDLGDANPRTFTITPNRYGSGSGTATLQIRGQVAAFVQDDNVLAWTTYTVPTLQSWRYVQVREIKSS